MDRDVQPITAQAVETIDNGQMNKALTRPVNAEELYHDKTKRKA